MRKFRADHLKWPAALEGGTEARRQLDQWLQGELPLELEIGCGVGLHPLRSALAHPDRNFLALERTREKFEKFLRRYVNHGSPKNLLPLHADAVTVVALALPSHCLSHVDLLYPNPYPQNPAARWMRMPFMEVLLDRLKPGGTLRLATNLQGYAEEAQAYAKSAWALELLEKGELRGMSTEQGQPCVPLTHFERKYLERGETCTHLIWRKP